MHPEVVIASSKAPCPLMPFCGAIKALKILGLLASEKWTYHRDDGQPIKMR